MITLAALTCLVLGGGSGDPTDRELERVWKRLSDEQRVEAVEWLRFECSELSTHGARLVRTTLEAEGAGAGGWPEAEPAPVFDAEGSTGRRKARKWLSDTSSKARGARAKFLPEPADPAPDRAYEYDWARGLVVRVADPHHPERVFANALLGVAPDQDLARALVLRRLDRGDERVAMEAFGHAYVDRRGNAYPGLTLYDTWASGERMEMPDTDVLGIAQRVLREGSRWSAPLSSNGQREVYAAIGERFLRVRRYRELRESLADVFLEGAPAPIGGYSATHATLHALWARFADGPAELARGLPDGEGWQAFLESLARLPEEDPETMARGVERRNRLLAEAPAVRARLVRVIQGMG